MKRTMAALAWVMTLTIQSRAQMPDVQPNVADVHTSSSIWPARHLRPSFSHRASPTRFRRSSGRAPTRRSRPSGFG